MMTTHYGPAKYVPVYSLHPLLHLLVSEIKYIIIAGRKKRLMKLKDERERGRERNSFDVTNTEPHPFLSVRHSSLENNEGGSGCGGGGGAGRRVSSNTTGKEERDEKYVKTE